MLAHTQHRFLVLANKTSLVIAGACAHWSASGPIGRCAHALLNMWVHAYFCNMQRTLGTELVSVTFVGLLVIIIAFAVILSPFSLPMPSHTTLRQTFPVSSFPVEDHWVGLPPSMMMIAFITIKSILVPLIESLCAQI